MAKKKSPKSKAAKAPRKPKAWKPTAFNIQKGTHYTITLMAGGRTGPTLSFGKGSWRCVQDEAFEQVLWDVSRQKDEGKTVRTGPTKRVKLANGQHKYIPDMKKIQEMYPGDFIEEAAESPTEEDD